MSEQLHPHWRIQYIRSRKEPGAGSPFAALLAANDDEANLILHRGTHCFVILNNSPYNPGHLMVLPNREVGELADLTAEARAWRAPGDVALNALEVMGDAIAALCDDALLGPHTHELHGRCRFGAGLADPGPVKEVDKC